MDHSTVTTQHNGLLHHCIILVMRPTSCKVGVPKLEVNSMDIRRLMISFMCRLMSWLDIRGKRSVDRHFTPDGHRTRHQLLQTA